MIYKARIMLIETGKVLPFLICFLVTVSYSESFVMLLTNTFVVLNESVIIAKPVSWFIGDYFEYNFQTLVVIVVISIAIETCIYNKLACGYLGLNLLEKSLFNFEFDVYVVCFICVANIVISSYIAIKGVLLLNKR